MTTKLKTLNFKTSVSHIIPKKELKRIEIVEEQLDWNDEISKEDEAFWTEAARFSKEDRRKVLEKENWGEDDLAEWQNL